MCPAKVTHFKPYTVYIYIFLMIIIGWTYPLHSAARWTTPWRRRHLGRSLLNCTGFRRRPLVQSRPGTSRTTNETAWPHKCHSPQALRRCNTQTVNIFAVFIISIWTWQEEAGIVGPKGRTGHVSRFSKWIALFCAIRIRQRGYWRSTVWEKSPTLWSICLS